MSLQIRPASVDDLHAVVTLLRARELPTDGFADVLRASPGNVLVAELNDALVGCAALDVHGEHALLVQAHPPLASQSAPLTLAPTCCA